MTHLRSPIAATTVCLSLLGSMAGCSSNDNGGGGTQSGGQATVTSGGQSSSGGSATTGGSSNAAVTQTGGASAATTTSNAGGSTPSTGGSATGGSTTGAATALGGSSAANTGTTATGGLSTGGATAAVGGSSDAGGTSSGTTNNAGGGSHVGGNTSTASAGTHVGGTANTGGTTNTAGGATHAGGTAMTGGTSSANTATGGSSQAGASSTPCASHVLSLSANGTSSAVDTAYAHVEVDLKTDLPIGNAPRTVEFWAYIKTTDWVGEKNEVYYYGGSASAAAFGLDFGTNPVSGSTTNHATLNPFTGGGFNDDSTNNLGINSSSDQWVHVAMTWDQSALRTYVNGLPKITTNGSSGTTALATAQSLLIIGCNPSNNNCFNGNFSEFRVWNVARNDTQIKDAYNKRLLGSEAGLVGYWRFDDAPGSATAADSVSTTGHTAHSGTLKADTAAHNPTFVAPTTPVPITCP